jgi:Neisseria PilC beta-propeller domain
MNRSFVARLSVAVGLSILLSLRAGADDKVILQSGSKAQHILILMSTGNSFTDIMDGSAAALGGADTPDAKIYQAKTVLARFINKYSSGSFYWALGTAARDSYATVSSAKGKEFIYMQTGNSGGYDFPCGALCGYAQPDGVIERWGPTVYANQATLTDPIAGVTYVSPGRVQNYGADGRTSPNKMNTVTLTPWFNMLTNSINTDAKVVETATSGHYYDFTFPAATLPATPGDPNATVVIKKQYFTRTGSAAPWVQVGSDANVSYVYKWGFVGTGGGAAQGQATVNSSGFPDNGNNALADDRASAGSTNCGAGWDSATTPIPFPEACPSVTRGSVPWATTPGANIPYILSQLRTLDTAINFNSNNGQYVVLDANADRDIVSPAGKTCVGNTLKGVSPYIASTRACLNSACTDFPIIWISDALDATDNQDPCQVNPPGSPIYTIYYGPQVVGRADSWIKTLPACSGGKAFTVTSPDELLAALEAALTIIDDNDKDFASATVSSVQTGTDQMAFLATFNASSKRAIWDGRMNGFKLDATGNIVAGHRVDTYLDAFGVASYRPIDNVPSSDPLWLKWNMGANLASMSTAADASITTMDDTKVLTQLTGGRPMTVGTYVDNSNDTPGATTPSPLYQNIPTYTWPGRAIVYATEQTTPGTVPEPVQLFLAPASPPAFASCNTVACPWYKLKTQYLGLTNLTAANPKDTQASQDIGFIRGNRNNTILAINLAAGCAYFGTYSAGPPASCGVIDKLNAHLYNDVAGSTWNGEKKLGDIFHSTPIIVGQPHKNAFYAADFHGYQSFFNRYYRRRQVIFGGANDGLFHAFDIGAFDRGKGFAGAEMCPNATSPTSSPSTQGGCYDLGTGTELFAYAPRAIMSSYDQMTQFLSFTGFPQEWTVDGEANEAAMYISNDSTSGTRKWTDVIVGSMREGSRAYGVGYRGSYFALDVTQPDILPAFDPANPADPALYTGLPSDSTQSPGCLGTPGSVQTSSSAGCAASSGSGATEYPRVLWEFNDTATNGIAAPASDPSPNLAADMDASASTDPGAGFPDLGETWSKAAMGLIELPKVSASPNNVHACRNGSGNCEDKYVAIFGGGFDSNRKNQSGNWIYVMDVETGNVLFKANNGIAGTGALSPGTKAFASIPSAPLAIDLNQDGYLDVVYFGDLNGNMWRMSLLGDPAKVAFDPSATTTVGATTYGVRQSIKISSSTGSDGDPWVPHLFFQDDHATSLIDSTCAATSYSYCTELAATCLVAGNEAPCTPTTGPPRSIYYSPVAVYQGVDSSTGKPILGIGFSTGERDDIMGTAATNSAPGSNYQTYRFDYVVDVPSTPLVTYKPGDLTNINTLGSPSFAADGTVTYTGTAGVSCVTSASGWYIPLPGDQFKDVKNASMIGERGISDVIAINGYLYFSTFSPGPAGQTVINLRTYCTQTGVARVWKVYYSLCYNGQLAATGTGVGQFASNPVAYVDQNGQIHVIDATETGSVYKAGAAGQVTSKLKSWKEQ